MGAQRQRRYDVVVYGATGVVGRLVARYLAANAPAGLSWAIAGRDAAKLRVLRTTPPLATAKLSVIVAAADDDAALLELCASTRVVLSCAGPFDRVGRPLVAACVRSGTHYCDTTGEVTFMRHLVQDVHADAAARGVCVIPCAGFDCVASDLANAAVHNHADTTGREVDRVTVGFTIAPPLGFSTGGVASLFDMFGALQPGDLHPDVLLPRYLRRAVPAAYPGKRTVSFDRGWRMWAAPYPLCTTNEPMVRRSNFVAGRRAAAYREVTASRSLVAALFWLLLHAATAVACFVPAVRRPVLWLLAPGFGPSERILREGSFQIRAAAHATNGETIRATAEFVGGDGYTFTAVAACQVALALCAGEHANRAGVRTPTSALGLALQRRMEDAGYRLTTE
jgi:short subunit dehydrogenase-like uncharacterized protein